MKNEAIKKLMLEIQENEKKHEGSIKDLQAQITALGSSKVEIEENYQKEISDLRNSLQTVNDSYGKKVRDLEKVIEISQLEKRQLEEARNNSGYDQSAPSSQSSEIDSLKLQLEETKEALYQKSTELERVQQIQQAPSVSSNHVDQEQEVVGKLKSELTSLKNTHFTWVMLALKFDRMLMRRTCNINSTMLFDKIVASDIHFTEWPSFLKIEMEKESTST